MVTYTVNSSLGVYTLTDTPVVTKALTQTLPDGVTDYFLTDSNIYSATMFGVQEASGDWLGTLFFGRTAVDAHGDLGFVPDVEIAGHVGHGATADAFAVDYVREHGSNEGLSVALFVGDDTLIGNGWGGPLLGQAGDDLIVSSLRYGTSNSFILDGGAGDDVLHASQTVSGNATVYGGAGDDFIFAGESSLTTATGAGADTLFFSAASRPGQFATSAYDFGVKDHIQFDPAAFTALADGFTRKNFFVGPAAKHSDDFIIYSDGTLYYDADGSGAQEQQAVAYLGREALTWRNIVVSDAIPVAGDPGTAAPSPTHQDAHAFALHAALHATGLLP